MKLNEYTDNYVTVYKVAMGGNKDITGTSSKTENVTRYEVRRMFQKFLIASPELQPRPRVEQIAEFNLERRMVRKPMVAPEILLDLEVTYTEAD